MDLDLVLASQRGDKTAFCKLVERYYGLACGVARRYGAGTDSRDAAQEAFVTAWQRLGELRDPERFRAWLCGIVRFTVCSARRHRRRHAPEATEALDHRVELVLPVPSVLDEMVERERIHDVTRAMESIPATYRDPLLLFYRDGKSIDQVAAELSLSGGAVRQRLSRGRKQLTKNVREIRKGFAAGVVGAILLADKHAVAATAPAATAPAGAGAAPAGGGWVGAGMLKSMLGAAVAAAAAVVVGLGAPSTTAPRATPVVAEGTAAPALDMAMAPVEAPRVMGELIEHDVDVVALDAMPRTARSARRRGRVHPGEVVVRHLERKLEFPTITLADVDRPEPPARPGLVEPPALDLTGDLDDF